VGQCKKTFPSQSCSVKKVLCPGNAIDLDQVIGRNGFETLIELGELSPLYVPS